MAEPHRPAQDGCAGKLKLARLEDDRFVEWASLIFVVFADEDAQQHGISRDLHVRLPSAYLLTQPQCGRAKLQANTKQQKVRYYRRRAASRRRARVQASAG